MLSSYHNKRLKKRSDINMSWFPCGYIGSLRIIRLGLLYTEKFWISHIPTYVCRWLTKGFRSVSPCLDPLPKSPSDAAAPGSKWPVNVFCKNSSHHKMYECNRINIYRSMFKKLPPFPTPSGLGNIFHQPRYRHIWCRPSYHQYDLIYVYVK